MNLVLKILFKLLCILLLSSRLAAQNNIGQSPVARGVAAENFPDVIHEMLAERTLSETSNGETVRGASLDAVASPFERAVISFLKGLEFEKINKIKDAAKWFEKSLIDLPQESQLYPVVMMHAEAAKLSETSPKLALQRIQAITKKYPSFREWKSEQYAFMLRVLIAARSEKILLKTWAEYLDKVRPAQRLEQIEDEVVQFVDEQVSNQSKELFELLESIAVMYPYSDSSRWAFQRLQTYDCPRKFPKRQYVPSLWFLGRLAGNAALDEGIKGFILSRINDKVRGSRGEIKVFDTAEKINFLIQSRMYSEALTLSQRFLDAFSSPTPVSQRFTKAKALYQNGQIHMRLNNWEQSAAVFSSFLSEFGDSVERRGAEEALADSLVRLAYYKEAAEIYGRLAVSSSVDPTIKWHHFWNLYMAREYKEALALLDRPGYVPSRDRGIEGGLDYWRAKILEKMGQLDNSEGHFRKILSSYGDTFYAILVQASKPALREALVDPSKRPESHDGAIDVEGELIGKDVFAAKLLGVGSSQATAESIKGDRLDVGVSKALQKWGEYKLARRLLRTTAWNRVIANKLFPEMADLAFSLGDYGFGLKVASLPESPFKNVPAATKDLRDHMAVNNADWKLMYPFAHERLVLKYADAAGIDPFLSLSIMRAESVYDPDARSLVGAQGLMQIMPFTAIRIARMMGDHKFEMNKLHMPEVNIGYASFYLKRLMDYYDGNVILAIAAYNAGPTAVDRWLSAYGIIDMDEFVECIPFKETRRYVKSVLRNMNHYQTIYSSKHSLVSLPKIPVVKSELEIF